MLPHSGAEQIKVLVEAIGSIYCRKPFHHTEEYLCHNQIREERHQFVETISQCAVFCTLFLIIVTRFDDEISGNDEEEIDCQISVLGKIVNWCVNEIPNVIEHNEKGED